MRGSSDEKKRRPATWARVITVFINFMSAASLPCPGMVAASDRQITQNKKVRSEFITIDCGIEAGVHQCRPVISAKRDEYAESL
jgi:hypothetical protein